ncbi:MAG: DUF177 domain-containing protein [Peptococcaceae bacterium]|jgi:uncharacterized protein|nr:DUF177 domain-containing protein [Peptococcaceae bacterium]
MLQLDVAKLKRSPGDTLSRVLIADLAPIEVSGDEIISFEGPVKAIVNATNTGQGITVDGTTSGLLRLNCSRCLEPFIYSLEAPLAEFYTTAVEGVDEEAIRFTGDYLDLTPEVLKSMLLELPMQPLCSEKCKGLCSTCGHNLNEGDCECTGTEIDPRLSVLRDLLKE